jgi:DNA-binding response OmpR family regulator
VTEPADEPVVLIVDEDVGFVFWLGEIFSEAGCQVVPALNYWQALSITRKLNLQVDVIVVDPDVDRVSQVIQTLSLEQRPFKVVAIRNRDTDAEDAIHAHATLERPSPWQPLSPQEWLERVRGILREIYATSGG